MGTSLALVERELTARLPVFAQVLPRDLSPERLMRTVLVSIERTPKLLNCSQQSIMNSALTAAVLALEVDGVTGQGFMIPYSDIAQFQIGYKGYPTIGARSGMAINSGVVREGDAFDYELGTDGFIRHKPKMAGRQGRKIIASWASGTVRDRPPVFAVMPYDDVLAIKARSPGAKKSDSPWNDTEGPGHEAMVAKTAVRRLGRAIPIVAFQRATALEDHQDAGRAAWLRPDGNLIVDAEATTYLERQPAPLAELAAPDRPRWMLADGSERTWTNPDLMVGSLLAELEHAKPEAAARARERNGANLAALSAAGHGDAAMKIADALAKRIGTETATQTASAPA